MTNKRSFGVCVNKKMKAEIPRKEIPALRCLADSNRRRRFCRPLTKPLIQGTL